MFFALHILKYEISFLYSSCATGTKAILNAGFGAELGVNEY
ncbi:hypothetical protein GCM10022395_16300 [Snuella lapsa]|uniref:Uncharacterized protein n=1 Tax=Snuella lapsa TaxID=870481 RepID=A0ABP6XG60_9FLAO